LRDKSLNYFVEFFEQPSELQGVPVWYAPADGLDYEHARRVEANEAGHLAREGEDPPDAFLVLEQYHGPERVLTGSEAARFSFLRSFYRAVRPGPQVREAVETWSGEHLDAPFVVGVNVRTGNGHYFGKGGTYEGRVDISLFEDEERFLRTVKRACAARTRSLPRPLRSTARIFYATDSEAMSGLLAGLPGAVTRRRVFPPSGSGDTYAFAEPAYSDKDAVVDTLVDMLLLARCDALVYNSSVFNQYARVITGCFSGNMVHLETLFLRRRLELEKRRLTDAARRRAYSASRVLARHG
jgi:hypothetical protein